MIPELTPEQLEAVLKMRHDGKVLREIATELGVSYTSVKSAVATYRVQMSAEMLEVADEYFQLHVDRLEGLWARVQKELTALPQFDEKVFKVAIQILERQAKLLGLDRGNRAAGVPRTGGQKDWLAEATPSELIAEIESYGLQVPERFKDGLGAVVDDPDAVGASSGAA